MPQTSPIQPERSFSVHGRDEAPSRNRRIEASDFQDAALAFLKPTARTRTARRSR